MSAQASLSSGRLPSGTMPSQPSQQSSQESDEPSRGRISRLDLFNFKSYGGKTSLGPFKDFSAVVGPNGAGSPRPPAPAPAPALA